MKRWSLLFIALPLLLALFGADYFLRSRTGTLKQATWQRMALPGELSKAHAFLEHNCAACHTSVKGVEARNCIACHANNESLLKRQPTAFHANANSCRECHLEHRGADRHPTDMDHLALARIGLHQLESSHPSDAVNELMRKDLLAWIDQYQPANQESAGHSSFTPQEAVLNCATCHSTKDRHAKLFGEDCAQCHTTAKWTIPEFRHPSPTSMDCAQCHQAPPSHYMMHFQMISAKVARQPTAKVNQCYECHQTTSWNDIKGVGYYKHH
jgi:hypothetical protein